MSLRRWFIVAALLVLANPFADAVAKKTPSPIAYNSPKPEAREDEDAIIQAYRINVKPEDVPVALIERAFQ